jgi:hypothetical protein
MEVELHTDDEIPREPAQKAREMVAGLESYVGRPLLGARLTLRRDNPHADRPFRADATVLFNGRPVVAHKAGRSPLEAAELAVRSLRRELRSLVGAEVGQRNEPAAAQTQMDEWRGLKPPEERAIVRRRTYVSRPLPTLDAVDDLLAMDVQFNLFRHARTLEDVVVHLRDDGAIGLLHPRGSVLADERDVVVPEPSRYSEPLTMDDARTEMDFLNHRWLYFTDAGDARGKVLYLRRDGDYGLVEPD